MKYSKVSVIIVNWNGKKHLDVCLSSVFNQNYPNYEVIVVDNGSTDGSVEFIDEKYPQVNLIGLNENTGFARGNNIGIKKAFEDPNVAYIACLNNDTKTDENWLNELVKAAGTDEKIGMCQSKILFMGTEKIHSTGILLYKDLTTTNRGMFEEDKGQYDGKLDIFGPIGCSALYSRVMLEKIDLGYNEYFDNDYFAYREDDDVAWRGRFAGFICVFVPRSVVYHVHSATGKARSSFKIYQTERNRIYNIVKILPWHMGGKSLFYSIKRYYLCSNQCDIKSEIVNKRLKFVFMRVILDIVKKLPTMLKKRKIIQKTKNMFFKKYGADLHEVYKIGNK
jgi:GT2 family glycosyltransferase